jgi:endoglucanase
MDNRLGCFVALEAARLVAEAGGAAGDVVAVAAVQEEITMGGARTIANRLDLDGAVVIDVTHATDAPGIEEKQLGSHKMGSGPVIERGSILHPRVSELLLQTAASKDIAHTVAASAGRTGTDADAIHFARDGVPTGLVSVPLRYMHSPVELVQISDVESTAQLLAEFALALSPDEPLARS